MVKFICYDVTCRLSDGFSSNFVFLFIFIIKLNLFSLSYDINAFSSSFLGSVKNFLFAQYHWIILKKNFWSSALKDAFTHWGKMYLSWSNLQSRVIESNSPPAVFFALVRRTDCTEMVISWLVRSPHFYFTGPFCWQPRHFTHSSYLNKFLTRFVLLVNFHLAYSRLKDVK